MFGIELFPCYFPETMTYLLTQKLLIASNTGGAYSKWDFPKLSILAIVSETLTSFNNFPKKLVLHTLVSII